VHWFWRVTIAVIVACVYGGLSVTVLLDAHEWVADGIGKLFSLTHPVRTGVGVPIAWFAPITLLAFAVFGLLTHWFGRPGFSDNETRCRRCGYILRGITEPRCPECGERI
jgi:hypothetical protein